MQTKPAFPMWAMEGALGIASPAAPLGPIPVQCSACAKLSSDPAMPGASGPATNFSAAHPRQGTIKLPRCNDEGLPDIGCPYRCWHSSTRGQWKRSQSKSHSPWKAKPCESPASGTTELVSHLVSAAAPVQSTCLHRCDTSDKLVSRRRTEEESQRGYAANLHFCVRRGYPTFDGVTQEEFALQAFDLGAQAHHGP